MEVNNGNKSDSMKKIEKVIQKWWIYYKAVNVKMFQS